jgi:hypothetical protein
MMLTLSLYLLIGVNGNSGLVHHSEPLSGHVDLSLSADRSSYYVKEPMRLKLALRNVSAAPVRGHFYLEPSLGFAEILYRRSGESFAPFQYPSKPDRAIGGLIAKSSDDAVAGPRWLKPAEETTYETVLSFDAGTDRFVFAEPGRYEIRVTYRDVPNEANAILQSNELTLEVLPTPTEHADAAGEYSKDLAYLTQFAPGRYSLDDRATVTHAVQFLERHPDSPYAVNLRKGLTGALYSKLGTNKATKEERELYEKLRADQPPNP